MSSLGSTETNCEVFERGKDYRLSGIGKEVLEFESADSARSNLVDYVMSYD